MKPPCSSFLRLSATWHIPSSQEPHSNVQIPQVASWPSGWRKCSLGFDEGLWALRLYAAWRESLAFLLEAGQILSEPQTIGLKDQGALPKGEICFYTSPDWSPVQEDLGGPGLLMPNKQINKFQKDKVNLLWSGETTPSFEKETLGFKCWTDWLLMLPHHSKPQFVHL